MLIREITTLLIEKGRGQNWLMETFHCTVKRDGSQLNLWEAPKMYHNRQEDPAIDPG